ncbi:histone-lysine N-methyltransferase family member SUVH9-like protein [Tanacetum coccineum]
MHGQGQARIDYLTSSLSSNGESIATSVIVSGGYEDDEDAGNVIVYTGHGGQDKHSRQVVHQKLEGGNLAMERSMHYGIEVRVIRGFKYEGSASGKVYVYDGLYKIVEARFDVARPLEARPMGYYFATTVFPQFVYHLGVKGGGCSCVSGCTLDCLCAKKNGGEFAYDANGLLVRGKLIEVIRSRETGWGVRSMDLIQAGSFICEYTGVVLTRDQAKLFTMNGDALVCPNRFGERWAKWGDLSQIFTDYVHH